MAAVVFEIEMASTARDAIPRAAELSTHVTTVGVRGAPGDEGNEGYPASHCFTLTALLAESSNNA